MKGGGAVLIGVAITLIVFFGGAAIYINHTFTVWEGERTFEVTRLPDPQSVLDWYWVESVDDKPDGADRDTVSELVVRENFPADVAVGDHLVCAVTETFRFNSDVANGPQAHVGTCRAAT